LCFSRDDFDNLWSLVFLAEPNSKLFFLCHHFNLF
jgi:hypothetical protein